MDLLHHLNDEFGIREDCVVVVSEDRFNCLIPSVWLETNCRNVPETLPRIQDDLYKNVHKKLASLLLARSTAKQNLEGSLPVVVNVVRKRSTIVESFVEAKLGIGSKFDELSNVEVRSHLDCLSRKCFEKEAKERFSHAHSSGKYTSKKLPLKDHDNLVVDVFKKLYGRGPVLSESYSKNGSLTPHSSVDKKGRTTDKFITSHPSLHPVYFVVETGVAFFVFQPFFRYTLADVIAFSPLKLSETSCKMFVFFEILMAVRHLHSLGVNVNNLRLSDFSVDDMLWVRLISLDFNNFYRVKSSTESTNSTPSSLERSKINVLNGSVKPQFSLSLQATLDNLPRITQGWINGEVSNFDYLMVLNKLSGRSSDEPNHHPLLPWVLDFSDPSSTNFRDLRKSKYRLNKGDVQLDLTFDSSNPESVMSHPNQTPFHVSDFLSDITYYVYVARKSPQDVLCRIVRPRWQPNHYPSNIGRLYEWTPDECIPAFYCDENIFRSCHDDLADLELPLWASDPGEFTRVHKSALESAEVSRNLHHWIDLTFGCRLTGIAATESKNVCLQLVDKHKSLMNHGVVQLFTSAHPERRANVSERFSARCPLVLGEAADERDFAGPENSDAEKSRSRTESVNPEKKAGKAVYDPLADLNHLEQFFHFCLQETHSLDENLGKSNQEDVDSEEMEFSLVSRDMQTLGCLAVELFFEKVMSSLSPDKPDLGGRYSVCRGLASERFHELPFFIKKCIAYLLNLPPSRQRPIGKCDSDICAAFTYPATNHPNDLPPPTIDLLLASQTGVLILPGYVNQLYHCLSAFHSPVPSVGSAPAIDPRGMHHLLIFLKKFFQFECNKNCDIMHTVVFPYVEFLLRGSLGRDVVISGAWNLFYYVGKCCSDEKQLRSMLVLMVNVFNSEETSPAFLRIYHRSFVSRMIAVFKPKTFLRHFSTLLVEAVSGFKDFSVIAGGVSSEAATSRSEGTKLDEEEEDEAGVGFDRDKNLEMDDFYKDDQDLLLLDGENDVEPDDAKSNKSGCPSTASLEDDESSAKSDANDPANVSNADNPSCEDEEQDVNEEEEEEEEDVTSSSSFKGDPGDPSSRPDRLANDPEEATRSNISGVARDIVEWLSDKLGPVLTAKHLSRNLLRMLVICYMPPLQLEPISPPTCLGFEACATKKYVRGDLNAVEITRCLLHISNSYGEQVILIQYLQHVKELVGSVVSCETLTAKREGYVVSSISLLLIILPHMSITSLVDSLEVLENDIIFPILNLLSSSSVNFSTSSPSSRSFVAFRLVDIIALISIRLGFDVTRCKIMHLIRKFFDGFQAIEKVFYEGNFHNNLEETSNLEINQSHTTHHRQQSLDAIFRDGIDTSQQQQQQQEESKEISELQANIQKQLNATYTCELAHYAYVTFCKLAGGICIEQNLTNDDLLRKMCTSYDSSVLSSSSVSDPRFVLTNLGDNPSKDDISVEGNKIIIKSSVAKQQKVNNFSSLTNQQSCEQNVVSDSQKRILRGDWLSYWEHEVGFGDRHHALNFKQMKLQTFRGHSSCVRCLKVMDCENSFISAGKDHAVKLWSLRNQGDGSAIVPCQATYDNHKKSVSSLLYVDSLKHVASSDGSVHIWDPFNFSCVRRVSLRASPVSLLTCLPPPSSLLLASSNDSVIRMIDCRIGRFVQSSYLKTSVIPSGHIKSMSVGADGHHVAVGFSTGIITTLDIRSGGYVSSWKAYDSDIVEMKVLGNNSILAFSLDLGANIWSFPNGKQLFAMRGTFEGPRWINHSESSLAFGYTSNRISICTDFDVNKRQGDPVSVKLKSDLIKGSLSCMEVLPLNHLFLLASDHGDITLAA